MHAPCPHCKTHEARVRYDFGRDKIIRCTGCDLLFLHPRPDPVDFAAVYGADYFQNAEFMQGPNATLYGYADYIAERANKQRQYARLAREILAWLPRTRHSPRLLEVGCGLGYFLDEAFEEGFQVTGIEFNGYAVERLRRKYAFPIEHGALEDLDLAPESFDAVVMFDVIEHLRDPFACLEKLHRALAPGGILVTSTPDAESFTSRLLGARLEDFRRTREHLYFFGRRTLSAILDEHGLDSTEIRSIGHTFELAFLLERLMLYNRPVFGSLRRAAQALGVGGVQLQINPRTKMISFARRRGVLIQSGPEEELSELDQRLMAELQLLDRAMPRHYRWVADLISAHFGRSVLEVGSGFGVVSQHLIGRCDRLVLSEYKPALLERLRRRFGEIPNVHYRLLDLEQRPYSLEGVEVDTILCLNVLEHLERDDEILRAFHELLPPGGRVILQVPNHPRLYGSLDRRYGHLRRYTRAGLRESLERAGFRVRLLRRFNPFSIPGWWFSGKLQKRESLSPRALALYDSLVPVVRRLDGLSRLGGLSLIACAERSEDAAAARRPPASR